MRRPLAIALVAAIALAILIAVCWHELAPAPAAGPEGGVPRVESASEPTADAESGARIVHGREPAWRAAASSPPGDPSHALVLGRCLAAEDGAPLPGCRLTISFPARTGIDRPVPERALAQRADAEGRFRVAVVLARPETCWLDVEHEDLAMLQFRWSTIAPGQVIDLGDLRLARGVLVTGRAIDTNGEPWPGLGLNLVRTDGAGTGPGAVAGTSATSDGDGRFSFAARVAPGAWLLHTMPPRELKSDGNLRLAAHETARDVQVLLAAPADVIAGFAIDEAGVPAADVLVQAGGGNVHPAKTDARGRFRLVRDPGLLTAPALRLTVDFAREFDRYESPEPIPWGTRDVQVVLRRVSCVEVQVLDAEERPVPDFQFQCFLHPDKNGLQFGRGRELQRVTGAPDGVAIARDVRTGANVLKVQPRDRERHPLGTFTEFTMNGRTAPRQVVRLPREARRSVIVVSGDGAPVPGIAVELIERIDPRLRLPADCEDLPSLFEGNRSDGGLCWCRAITGADGTVELLGPAGPSWSRRAAGAACRR